MYAPFESVRVGTLSNLTMQPRNLQVGVAVMNRDDITLDGFVARFHALERSGADWLNIFLLPAADAWLPWVRRWKTRCAGCPNAGALSCYEPSLDC